MDSLPGALEIVTLLPIGALKTSDGPILFRCIDRDP